MYPCELTTAPQVTWSTVWEQEEVLSSLADINSNLESTFLPIL